MKGQGRTIKGKKAFYKFFLLLTIVLLNNSSALALARICPEKKSNTECAKALINYPLFDTPYKLAANYIPILPLRALAHGEIYREKKTFKLERYYYVKNISGAFGEPYAKLIGSGKVSGSGIIGRKVSFDGHLNEFKVKYLIKMSFSLPKKAKMKVSASIDDIDFLELIIRSDGDAMTNDVEGTFFGKTVKYHTHHRDTDGTLAGQHYKLHTEGKVKEEGNFHAITKGGYAGHSISGSVVLTAYNKYYSTEYYGPIMVKSYITVIDAS